MIKCLIFNLFMAHILGDFYLQGKQSCDRKIRDGIRGRDLWLHAFLIGALSWVAVWDCRGWWLALGIFVLHLLIDWLKSFLQIKMRIFRIEEQKGDKRVVAGETKQWDLWMFLADQALHLMVLVVGASIWLSCNKDWSQFVWLQNLAVSHPVRVKTAAALLLALKPANLLVLLTLDACKVKMGTENANDGHGNFHSGELIGWLERGLILLFVVLSQYEAIGFLVAAKSILRFGEASKDEKSEYVLTGTLLSLAIAVCLGLVVFAF